MTQKLNSILISGTLPMDHNQTEFSTRLFESLNDSHRIDCSNLLQVIKGREQKKEKKIVEFSTKVGGWGQ